MGETYRETALEQAVISHGKVDKFDGMTGGDPRTPSDLVVCAIPNDPAEVVKAAATYERFLDRSPHEAEQWADKLAEALSVFVTNVADPGSRAATVLREYREWKTLQAEPF